MNFVILFALMIQGAIAKSSRSAGGIVGLLITSGVLIWGLGAYSAGDAIAFFGIPLSKPVFIGACVLWYLVDLKETLSTPMTEGAGTD